MSKTMILAETGFGKSLSAVGNPDVGIEGLNPKRTYFISATSKDLPRRGSRLLYPVTTLAALIDKVNPDTKGRRVITNDPYEAAKVIEALIPTPIKDIVIDDSNYFMQDYFMEKALQTGWDAPKKVGHMMHKLFAAMEKADAAGKNIYMIAHYEDYKKTNTGEISFRMKTTGKSVQEYITPEGKFDIVLFGKQYFNNTTKLVERSFVTNHDGEFPAKSPPGMFPDIYLPNDLGVVAQHIKAYYDGEEIPVPKVATPATVTAPVTQAVPATPSVAATTGNTASTSNPVATQPVVAPTTPVK